MTKDEAKNYILEHSTDILQKDKSGHGFICPICGSGSGKHGTGITSKDGNIHFTCWADCFEWADIIDIIGLKNGLTEYTDKLQATAQEFNLTIDGAKTISLKATPVPTRPKPEKEEAPQTDYTDFFLQAHSHIAETDYRRGLTDETLDRFKVGYVADWTHPDKPNMYMTSRLIIPTSKYSYVARNTDPQARKENRYIKVGKTAIFNGNHIYTASKPVFITEGEFDALSVLDVGGEAVALGSTSNTQKLINTIEKEIVTKNRKPTQPLIIAMDNDEPGRKAEAVLVEGFKRLNLSFITSNIAKPYKDANELLMNDREALKRNIEQAEETARAIQTEQTDEEAEKLEIEREKLKKEAVAYSIDSFLTDIENSKTASYYSTGFKNLDKLLDGGLYAGLYIVGAISSLGKTTFCLQMADNIASSGNDVLVFSLEMARNELIAKSVSRNTYLLDTNEHGNFKNAKTTRGILTGARYSNYSADEKELINNAIELYKCYSDKLYITEGIGNIGINEIKERIVKHITITGKAPVVIIDYLQIIAPTDPRFTDKQNTDKAVLELKRISRDFNIPVLAISSFNRDNYNEPVNLSSFKESGAIEYSSDVLIGLQYYGMDYNGAEDEKKRKSRIRELINQVIAEGRQGLPQKIQVKILKNRNGSKGDTVLNLVPMFNCFEDTQTEQTDEEAEKPQKRI